jgi:hypothetical protein
VVDALREDVDSWGYGEVQPHQTAAIDRSVEVLERMKAKVAKG